MYRNNVAAKLTVKTMPAKFPGRCSLCNQRINVGEMMIFTAYPSGQKSVKHETDAQCQASKPKAPTTVTLDLKSIVDFIKGAQDRGLKRPKLRVLDVDGRSELRLSLTKVGVAPGSLAVVRNGEYEGGVRPDGTVVGKLASNVQRQQLLLTVAKDPDAAAKQYAGVMSQCCYCGKPLTDAGSVECGYGPICAKNWGRPHTALGSTVLTAVPGTQQGLPLDGKTRLEAETLSMQPNHSMLQLTSGGK